MIIKNCETVTFRHIAIVVLICFSYLIIFSAQSVAETPQENKKAIQNSIASWEREWALSDPDYNLKKDRVLYRLESILIKAKRDNMLPQTVKQAVAMAEKAREDVESDLNVIDSSKKNIAAKRNAEASESPYNLGAPKEPVDLFELYGIEPSSKEHALEQRAREWRERQKWQDFQDTIFYGWLIGIAVFFISTLLSVWAYVISKYGILVGGSIGIAPPIAIAFVLSPLWPLIILAAVLVSIFKKQYLKIIKDRYLTPFRVKTVSNP